MPDCCQKRVQTPDETSTEVHDLRAGRSRSFDDATGTEVALQPGRQRLGPHQALGFARGRYYYVQDANGRWAKKA